AANQVDVGVFAGDDWKARPNLTVSLGARYEAQTNIRDQRDFAARVGVAWAPGGRAAHAKTKTVIRAGFGIFYDRFGLANTLTALRRNGIVQQQYAIAEPNFFPDAPPIASLGAAAPPSNVEQVSPDLRAPYLMQSAVSWERQLPRSTTVAVTFANTH